MSNISNKKFVVSSCLKNNRHIRSSPQVRVKIKKSFKLPHVRPSKLVTCLNDDGCFEGVPSLATVSASFEAWGIVTRHRHAFAK